MKEHAKDRIINLLEHFSNSYLAVHEIPDRYFATYGCYINSSENAIASRLDELAKAGKVTGKTREGFRYKEWAIIKQLELQGSV